ncbi:MAG: HAD hydrolase-like protein [bacterium]|nr:HAD hydrolase-like protein [bacterium]
MSDPALALKTFRNEHGFLIGIDSDGCVFDTMEIKHKECFIPNIINYWELQAVSKYAREAAEFVNLYSKWRGINRFPALLMTFDLLAERDEVGQRGVIMPQVDSLRKWVDAETRLGNPALESAVTETGDQVLILALEWSRAVNVSIEEIVRGVPPFPFVRESLRRINEQADALVVSATPNEALVREWQEHDIDRYVKVIAGQEMGNKKEHLSMAIKDRYAPGHVLMIGDAPGDYKAAKANNALFYPINPGYEAASWQRFHDEALDRFISGQYSGAYEAALIAEFNGYLPEKPPWKDIKD